MGISWKLGWVVEKENLEGSVSMANSIPIEVFMGNWCKKDCDEVGHRKENTFKGGSQKIHLRGSNDKSTFVKKTNSWTFFVIV